ncbi:hemicentin-2 [Exaiptasia diaphana]|uniref:Uncharacterized protein n=1 Tax=Exaiptasia diaphana TaxID=2652724 RepID=A0A913X1L2_EXADI|nr:hemicentin-2 [Exaiptasia diaphana]XP_028514059.1 hemicentin-2 [Exaiptasia diaphana]KXJ16084.1 Contactin-3 [Exaiptasia diaphana]
MNAVIVLIRTFFNKYLVLLGLRAALATIEGCVNFHPVGVANRTIISNSQMSASTSFYASVDYLTPKYGRLGSRRAWCAKSKRSDDWLQVDMGNVYLICGVATQGKTYRVSEWTTNYTLSVSRDGVTWQPYQENGVTKFWKGNDDGSSIVRRNLTSPVWTRYVRFYVNDFQVFPCLRVEIFVEFTSPVIKMHPKPAIVQLGGNFRLDCLAKGSPRPEIAWKLNGNDVIGQQLKNGSLEVKNVENDKSFEGTYRCIARNLVGQDVSDANVSVFEKPKILDSSPLTKSFLLGATGVLSCYAIGDPHPTIAWMKDGSTHIPRAKLHDDNHVLVISNVSAHDQGLYQCVAHNDIGQALSSTHVKILDHPTIDTSLTRKLVQTGLHQTVNMGCYGNSILPVTYSWSKNKVLLHSNDSNGTILVFGKILVVTPKAEKDYGIYTCHVRNSVDSTDFEIELRPIALTTNHSVSGPVQSNLSCSPPSCNKRLGIIISLVLVFVLSVAMNIRFIYHTYQIKKLSKTPSKPIPMNTLTREESNLIKDTEIAWDNLLPEASAQRGAFVNAGVISDKEALFSKQINIQT